MSNDNEWILVNSEDEFNSLLKNAIDNPSISCFLYTFGQRKSAFRLFRDKQANVEMIFHKNLGRGLPAAHDILHAIVATGFNQDVKFIDISQVKLHENFHRHGLFFSHHSTTETVLTTKECKKAEMTFQYACPTISIIKKRLIEQQQQNEQAKLSVSRPSFFVNHLPQSNEESSVGSNNRVKK